MPQARNVSASAPSAMKPIEIQIEGTDPNPEFPFLGTVSHFGTP